MPQNVLPRQWSETEEALKAAKTKISRVYDCTFGAQRNISIVDQQIRSLLLAQTLCKTGKVTRESNVCVVGAGFSGMTVAVALAMRTNCKITMFEQSSSLLPNYQKAAFRFVHPRLNMQGSRTLLLGTPHELTSFPILNWRGDYAPQIADQFLQKFQHYRVNSDISVHLKTEVVQLARRRGGVTVKFLHALPGLSSVTQVNEICSDLVLLATGFGSELTSDQTNDSSYWESGNPSTYRQNPLRAASSRNRERVLIAGNGDSGILELAHYLIPNLKHEELSTVFNDIGIGFRSTLAEALTMLPYRMIETGDHDIIRFVPGPVNWYWNLRRRLNGRRGSALRTLFEPHVRKESEQVYSIIHNAIGTRHVADSINESTLLDIAHRVRRPLDAMASIDIARVLRSYDWRLDKGEFGDRDPKFNVTLIGKTPTPYSRAQSATSWLLLRVIELQSKFRYERGAFENAEWCNREFRARFKTGRGARTMRFDKIVVRTGPDRATLGNILPIRNIRSERPFAEEPQVDAAEMIAFFRTRRWHSISRTLTEFVDRSGNELAGQPSRIEAAQQADDLYLELMMHGQTLLGRRLYKAYKRAETKNDRRLVLVELRKLTRAVEWGRLNGKVSPASNISKPSHS